MSTWCEGMSGPGLAIALLAAPFERGQTGLDRSRFASARGFTTAGMVGKAESRERALSSASLPRRTFQRSEPLAEAHL